tara:strand:+ start:631 stop:2367 length:1737 start_codon:yes stop_codon:yes gene_type:complete
MATDWSGWQPDYTGFRRGTKNYHGPTAWDTAWSQGGDAYRDWLKKGQADSRTAWDFYGETGPGRRPGSDPNYSYANRNWYDAQLSSMKTYEQDQQIKQLQEQLAAFQQQATPATPAAPVAPAATSSGLAPQQLEGYPNTAPPADPYAGIGSGNIADYQNLWRDESNPYNRQVYQSKTFDPTGLSAGQLGSDKWDDFDYTHDWVYNPNPNTGAGPQHPDGWGEQWDWTDKYWRGHDRPEQPYSSHDLAGVGWMPTNQEINRQQYHLGDYSSDNPWKTKWVGSPFRWDADRYGRDWETNQPQTFGWEPGVHMTTGQVRKYDPFYKPVNEYGEEQSPSTKHFASEILNYDNYTNDPHYSKALEPLGIDRYSKLQDILDADAYFRGQSAISGQAKADRDQRAKIAEQLEWQAANTPQYLDGSTPTTTTPTATTPATPTAPTTPTPSQTATQNAMTLDSLRDYLTNWQNNFMASLDRRDRQRWGVRSERELDHTQMRFRDRISDLQGGYGLNQQLGGVGDYNQRWRRRQDSDIRDRRRGRTASYWNAPREQSSGRYYDGPYGSFNRSGRRLSGNTLINNSLNV